MGNFTLQKNVLMLVDMYPELVNVSPTYRNVLASQHSTEK